MTNVKLMLSKAQQRSDETKKVLQSVEDDCRTWLPRLKEMLSNNYDMRLKQVNTSWEGLLSSLKEELDGSKTAAKETCEKFERATIERDNFKHQLTGMRNVTSLLNPSWFFFHYRVKDSTGEFEKWKPNSH